MALDGELCVLARVPVSSPRLLATDADGLWVASAFAGRDPAAARLLRLDTRSGTRRAGDFGALLALCSGEGGAALVLAQPDAGDSLLWRVSSDFRRTLLGAFPAARALAARPGEILVACAGGELALLRSDGAMLALGTWPEAVLALACGPRAGTWWVLGGGAERRLGLAGSELAPRWSVRTEPGASGFAPVPHEERVWLAAGARVLRYGPSGALELTLELEGGPWVAAAALREGVLLYGVGAVVELRGRGERARSVRTQGGFDALAALALLGGPFGQEVQRLEHLVGVGARFGVRAPRVLRSRRRGLRRPPAPARPSPRPGCARAWI